MRLQILSGRSQIFGSISLSLLLLTGCGGEQVEGSGRGDGGSPDTETLQCDEAFNFAGHDGCISEINGLSVKFFAPPADTQVERLVLYFHGDGGDGWTNNWGFDPEILDFALSKNYLVLGVRAPSSYDGETSPAYGAAQPEHANQIATLVEEFLSQYQVSNSQSLYWGVSGGSWFFTSSFIPVAAHRVPGVFVANCGGAGFSFGWAWDPSTDTETLKKTSLYFNYGELDFLADGAGASLVEYTGLGFTTGELVHPGAMHCAHPIAGPTLAFWAEQL